MALFQSDCWPAIFRDDVGSRSSVETQSISSCPDHVTSCFLELERLNQEFKSKLRDDFLNILNGMSSIGLSSIQKPPSPSPTPPSRSLSLVHDASFATEAYSWLLENIANPYPSPTLKTSLAQRYNCSLAAVNTWFVNARRRMGWTALCRDRFNNCRADALDAAYRAFVREDPKRQLSADIIHAFISVKVAIEELHSSTLSNSTLSHDLDGVVEDAFKQGGLSVDHRESSKSEGKAQSSKLSDVNPQDYNQSPDYSPSSSSISTLEFVVGEGKDDEQIVPPTLAGRKRRRYSSEGTHATTSESTARAVKRPRIPSSTKSYPPSPAASEEPLENVLLQQFVLTTQGHPTSGPCETPLSDANLKRLPTPSPDLVAGPHLHAASDSSPLSTFESEHSIDEWFKTNFDALFTLPPPVDVAEPDYSTQWEVELFSNFIIPEDSQNASPPTQANQMSSTDFIAFEDILQNFQSGGSLEMSPPPTIPVGPVFEGLPLSPDFSQTIDWTTVLNSDSCEPTCGSTLPEPYINSTLPEIDLSFLQLPQAWATAAS